MDAERWWWLFYTIYIILGILFRLLIQFHHLPVAKRARLEKEKGVIIRFVIGHSATPGGVLDRAIDAEDEENKDFLRLNHVEGYHELSSKTRLYFSTAVSMWDADFYVKIDDDVHLNVGKLKHFFTRYVRFFSFLFFSFIYLLLIFYFIFMCVGMLRFFFLFFIFMGVGMLVRTLARHRYKPRIYIGCMKSGPVLSQK